MHFDAGDVIAWRYGLRRIAASAPHLVVLNATMFDAYKFCTGDNRSAVPR